MSNFFTFSDMYQIKYRLFHHLGELNLSYNHIELIPRYAFTNMTNLYKLDLSYNKIVDIKYM